MLFGTLQKLSKLDQFSISVNGSAVKVLLSLITWMSFFMNTSAGVNMLKLLFLKLVGRSVC